MQALATLRTGVIGAAILATAVLANSAFTTSVHGDHEVDLANEIILPRLVASPSFGTQLLQPTEIGIPRLVAAPTFGTQSLGGSVALGLLSASPSLPSPALTGVLAVGQLAASPSFGDHTLSGFVTAPLLSASPSFGTQSVVGTVALPSALAASPSFGDHTLQGESTIAMPLLSASPSFGALDLGGTVTLPTALAASPSFGTHTVEGSIAMPTALAAAPNFYSHTIAAASSLPSGYHFWSTDSLSETSGAVTQINDQIGSDDITFAGGEEPTYAATSGPNSVPRVRFDGTNDWGTVTLSSARAADYSIVFVVDMLADTGSMFDGKDLTELQIQMNYGGIRAYAGGGGSIQIFPGASGYGIYVLDVNGGSGIADYFNWTGGGDVSADCGFNTLEGVTMGGLANKTAYANFDFIAYAICDQGDAADWVSKFETDYSL